MAKRPTGALVLGVLAILFGLGALVTGGLLAASASPPPGIDAAEWEAVQGMAVAVGGLVLLSGVLWLVGGFGALGMKRWGWMSVLAAAVLLLVASAVMVGVGALLLGLGGIVQAILLLLVAAGTRGHYGFGPAPPTGRAGLE
jgi:hypothetical protein